MAFLNEQDAAFVRARFDKELEHDVTLEFFAPSAGGLALPGQDWELAEYTRQILTEVAGLAPKIHVKAHSIVTEPEAAQTLGIVRTGWPRCSQSKAPRCAPTSSKPASLPRSLSSTTSTPCRRS